MNISIRDTIFLRAFGFTKVPMLFFVNPSVTKSTPEEVVISIPFHRRNKNHLGSMYFGTLCIGADAAGGFIAAKALQKVKNGKGSLIFKDFKAKFLKRPEGRTLFTCKDGMEIQDAVKRAEESLERVDLPVTVIATVPDKFGDEPVAEFVLTLSLKVKK
jgi:acyl-coenzyme A thioesterase PaaI-like protein